jgi:hypothetical protein
MLTLRSSCVNMIKDQIHSLIFMLLLEDSDQTVRSSCRNKMKAKERIKDPILIMSLMPKMKRKLN